MILVSWCSDTNIWFHSLNISCIIYLQSFFEFRDQLFQSEYFKGIVSHFKRFYKWSALGNGYISKQLLPMIVIIINVCVDFIISFAVSSLTQISTLYSPLSEWM
jgi:hypothetical protein